MRDAEEVETNGPQREAAAVGTNRAVRFVTAIGAERAMREAAAVWSNRAMREQEATLRFKRLAAELRTHGAPAPVVAQAESAAEDEARHELRCAWLAEQLGGLVPYSPPVEASFAPPRFSPRDALLYDMVATCCVAETINTALLLSELDVATEPRVREVTREVLSDEVRHGRLGWTWLADEAARGQTRAVAERVPRILALALSAEHESFVPKAEQAPLEQRNAFGMLSRSQRNEVLRTAVFDVVLPGFSSFGIDVRAASRAAAAALAP